MQTRPLGQSDVRITPILMGTWQAGKRWWVGIDDRESIEAIRAAVDAGITTIDTAEVYGDGHSERIIGEALQDIPRDRVEIASKVFANHLRADETIAACERSLQNLRTDYLDLYQIHWPAGSFNNEIVPVAETMDALNRLQQQGKIRAIGVSNFSLAQLQEAQQYGRIDSVQPPYSLFWQHVAQDLQPYCVANNITILAYSPLAQGLLTGKFGPDHKFAAGDHRSDNRLFHGETFQRAQAAIAQLQPIAASYGCTLGQLALAWLIAQPNACAIAGARSAQQARENAQAAALSLSEVDLRALAAISQPVIERLSPDKPVMWTFVS
ncbi:MAG: aldo/keto reductase [Cyanobacteria bacterium J06641_5]